MKKGANSSLMQPLLDAKAVGENIAASIDAAADYLMRLMQQVNGGNWLINIDHQSRLVMIVEKSDTRPVAPKRRVIV